MSTDESLVGNVPYLRRFARALTGSQELGDACVVAALERVLEGKDASVPARIGLYRYVLAEVNALEVPPHDGRAGSGRWSRYSAISRG